MGPRTLVLVRHGQSVRNVVEDQVFQSLSCSYFQNEGDRQRGGIFEDRAIPLTPKGHEQARKTGQGLKETFGVFDLVIHSGYIRTMETTMGILEAYSDKEKEWMMLQENTLIRERDPGYCHNMTIEEVKKHFPWMENYWKNGEPFFRVPAGGESIAQMCSGRLFSFLNTLDATIKRTGAKKILVVSHGRAILGMRYILEGWDYATVNYKLKHENPPNCAVNSYQRSGTLDEWEPQLENEVFYD